MSIFPTHSQSYSGNGINQTVGAGATGFLQNYQGGVFAAALNLKLLKTTNFFNFRVNCNNVNQPASGALTFNLNLNNGATVFPLVVVPAGGAPMEYVSVVFAGGNIGDVWNISAVNAAAAASIQIGAWGIELG